MNAGGKNIEMLGFGLFTACPDISHFITTRSGGYSEGNYASFNCSPYSGDEPRRVAANQKLLTDHLPANLKELVIPFQVHGTEVYRITPEYLSLPAEEKQKQLHGIDALVTDVPGVCICVSTADCVPLLLYDRTRKVVAVAHAGWRGTVNKILTNLLETMRHAYGSHPGDIIAGIAPSISLQAFEVGEEVYTEFKEKRFPMEQISVFNTETGKHHIDLWEANRIQLINYGIPENQIECSGICTYTQHHRFFSARRLGIKSGRILSGIMIKP